MINKNFYRKTNDKKILHKVGKQWKVISVALLMAIAGGAAATHANANADVNADNASVDDTVAQLNTSATANPPHNAAKVSANSSVASSASVSGGPYYYSQANNGFEGYNGSAASYFDNVDKDNTVVNKNFNVVNSYVQSLNNEYNPQLHSFAVKSNSAKNAASNDSKLAKSYAATARNTNTFNTVNSLAAKRNLNPSVYTDMVQDQEQIYSNAVDSASADVKANSDVASLVNKLENTDFSAASLSASTANVVTSSNLNAASYALASVSARYNSNTNDNASNFVAIANKLSADMIGLDSNDNPIGQGAAYASLMTGVAGNDVSATNSALRDDASKAGVQYKNYYANALSSAVNNNDFGSLNDFANSLANSAWVSNADTNNSSAVVSEAANSSFAGILASAVSSLYGKYNVASANAFNNSAVRSSAIASAQAAYNAAYNAYHFASANSIITDDVSSAVNGKDRAGRASVAYNYLTNGLTSFAGSVGIYNSQVTGYSYGPSILSFGDYSDANNGLGTFASALASNVDKNGSNKLIDDAVLSSTPDATVFSGADATSNQNSVVNSLKAAANVFSLAASNANSVMTSNSADGDVLVANSSDYEINAGKALSDFDHLLASGVHSANNNIASASAYSLISDTNLKFDAASVSTASTSNTYNGASKGVTASDVSSQLDNTMNVLNSMATSAAEITGGANGKNWNGLDQHKSQGLKPTNVDNDYFFDFGALLSDGVDLDNLSDEANAISNVANAVTAGYNSASVSDNDAEKLANGLNYAASSAHSAENSATNASASYSAANDENVTLSSYFASSYASDADNESEASVDENNSMSTFLQDMAGNSDFTNADNAYNNAQYAAAKDYKLGVGYAQAIYNNHAHFLDVLKNAKLHSTPNFGSKNLGDKIVGSVNKGDRLTVYGVNVSRNHNWRGVVRYYVKDNTNGNKGFVTGQLDYTKPAYLSAIGAHNGVEVKTLKPVNVYDQENGGKVVAQLPAGKVLEDADVVYDNADEDAYGFTKVETASDDYLTANTDYVEILNPTVNNNNNVPSNFNFNLGTGQNMAPYYNNLSQN